MALTATIFKAELQIADMDRGHYASHSLTVARHPSETDERMMVRLLAFALHADERLAFTKGLSSEDEEPDLWQKSLTGEVELWVEVGLPDERHLRKACRRSGAVVVYAYGGRAVASWWQKLEPAVREFENLRVFELPFDATQALTSLVARTMHLQCTVQEGQVWLVGNDGQTVFVELRALK